MYSELINLHDRTAGIGILRGGWLFIGDFFDLNYFINIYGFANKVSGKLIVVKSDKIFLKNLNFSYD